MSAPPLHPATRMRPVLLERLELQRGAYCWAALSLAIVAVWLRVDSVQVPYLIAVACVLLAGFALALLHEDQPVWDAAMPVDPARNAMVRLVCGAVWTAFLLAVVVGLYAALFGDPEHPGWYPLALFAWGLTCYLLISAALLRPGGRGRFLVYPVLFLLSGALLAVSIEEPAELGRVGGVSEVLARTALPLGLAGAAAYATARSPAPVGRAAGHARAPRWDPAGALPDRPAPRPSRPPPRPSRPPPLPDRPAPRPVRRSAPRRPPAALTVARQHFALLRRRTVIPVVVLALYLPGILLVGAGAEPGTDRTVRFFVESVALGQWCVAIVISWTVLVWLDEHGAKRRWNDALPVGTGERRVLHAAAGATWLLLFLLVLVVAPIGGAAVAGTLNSPADVPTWLWLGLPCRALTLYLTATFVFFGTRVVYHLYPALVEYVASRLPDVRIPNLDGLIVAIVFSMGLVGVLYVYLTFGVELVESQVGVLTGGAGPNGWSRPTAALWLMPYAAAVAGTITLNDWIHRHERIPTVSEVRRLLRSWARTAPGTALHRHTRP